MTPLRTAVIYGLFAGLWILLSDRVVELFAADAETMAAVQTIKGWLFVTVTAVLVFFLVRNDASHVKGLLTRLDIQDRRYRALVQHFPNGAVFLFDRNARILLAHGAILHEIGIEEEKLEGASLYDIISPEKETRVRQLVTRALSGETVKTELDRDGRWYVIHFLPLPDETGAIETGMVMSQDVTVRRNLEEELRRSEARYRSIVEDQTDMIVRWLPDGTRTFVNEAYARYFATSREELIGTSFFPLIHESDRDDVLMKIQSLTPGTPIKTDIHMVHRPDGTVGWQEWTDRGFFDESGTLVELQSVGRDITEQRQMEAQFVQAQKLESVGRLAGGVAHDFNNLLTVISGYVDIMLDSIGSDGDPRNDLLEIRKTTDRAVGLTRQLLAFSRRQECSPQVVDLADLVDGMSKMLDRLVGETVKVKIEFPDDLWLMKVDPGQVEQVVANLAVNAHDAMPGGGVITLTGKNVTIDETTEPLWSGQQPGEYVMLSVTDTGVGINRETMNNIFEPFFTTKELGKGTGLGLSTCYGIVQQSGGGIHVDSEPGEGTEFRIFFPRTYEDMPSEGSDTDGDHLHGTESILVVEDEEGIRRVIKRMLGSHGYTVQTASDGLEALEYLSLQDNRADLVLTDVVMPRMGGYELVRIVRKERSNIRFILISGYSEESVRRESDMTDIQMLRKPFTVETLLTTVRQTLDRGIDS